MERARRAELLALAVTAWSLAGCTSSPTEPSVTGAARLPLGSPSWYVSGRSAVGGSWASFTLLPDATVLIASDNAELYDPATGTFTSLEGPELGWSHRAVLLRTGEVALFGDGSVSFYDPANRTFSQIARCEISCGLGETLLLPDGNVLVTGDGGKCGSGKCFAVFNVASRSFSGANWLYSTDFSLTLLPNGKLLHAQRTDTGGNPLPAELLDPTTGEAFEVGSMLHSCAGPHALLPDGRVLFCCGEHVGTEPPPRCEYYDPRAGTFVEGPSRAEHHQYGAMVVLPSGDVMLVNGWSRDIGSSATMELLERGASNFELGPSTAIVREQPRALVLPSGKVLVAGGNGGRQDGSASPIELYDPGIAARSVTQLPDEVVGRATAPLPDGGVLLCGNEPARVYDPITDRLDALKLTCSGSIGDSPSGTTTLLPSGRLLVVDRWRDAHAEIIDPVSDTVEKIPGTSRERPNATVLSSGAVLVSGGRSLAGDFIKSAELFEPSRGRFVALPDMHTSGGVSALLGSGKVLFVTPEFSSDPFLTELFDPTRPGSDLLGRAPAALRFVDVAGTLGSGDVLLGASGAWALFSAETETLEIVDSIDPGPTSNSTGTTVALLTGDRLFCGYGSCTRYVHATGRFVESFDHGVPASFGFGLVASATGIVVASEVSAEIRPNVGVRAILRLWPFPPDAVRPELDAVPERLVSGVPVTLTGSRFTQPSAVGATSERTLDRHPLVAFVPVSGGGPVFSRVMEWTDTSLRWIAPTTPFRGPGWVHVYVDGIPSVGRFTFLGATPGGIACSSAIECSSGYCTDGVCCDRPCHGDCESCLAANQVPGGTDGVCAPVQEGEDPKRACLDSLCGFAGNCDGQGHCVVSGSVPACSPYLCRDSRCLTTCDDASDCATGHSCTAGACGRCSSDGEGIERGSSTFSCAPYRCEGGQCGTACDSRDDCAPNHRCDQGDCVPGAEFELAVDPGACSATPRSKRSSSLPWLLPVLAWLMRGRLAAGRARKAAA